MSQYWDIPKSEGMDDDKPFVCIEAGCGQRFTNEDHLSVHMRKHEMCLALNPGINLFSGTSPSRMGGLILDQTPTPTKFLKNCEEIGLFQELNKNPFEEAFKKALDGDGDQGVSGIPLPGPAANENELNTPIPHIPRTVTDMAPLIRTRKSMMEKLLKNEPRTPEEEEQEIINVIDKDGSSVFLSKSQVVMSTTTLITAAHSTTQSPPKTTIAYQAVSQVLPQSQCTMQIFLQLPNGTTVPVQIPASIPSIPVIQTTQQQRVQPTVINQSLLQSPQQSASITSPQKSQTLFTKQKLKQAIQQQTLPSPSSRPNTQIIQVSPDGSMNSSFAGSFSHNSPLSVDTSFASDTASSPDTVDSTQLSFSSKRSRRDDDDDPVDGRRKKFLERNRAAAARCRQKRKNWINNLEKRSSDLQQTNNKLQGEISLLRTEVAQLKTLLLAHKDCPVTHALQKQGAIPNQFSSIIVTNAESEIMEDTPVNLTTPKGMDNNAFITSLQNILSEQTIASLSTVAGSSGETRTITIPTIIGNTVEHKTIRIVPAMIAQENSKPVRKK